MKVLITAGPTQEPIDEVRYITNASSGRMGAALANEAIQRGYEVTLVHGPVNISLPDCKKIPVRTTQDMVDAVLKELENSYDILISTAAISDYAIKKHPGKIKSGQCVKLELEPTKKLICEAKKEFPKLFMVGFKAEYGLRRDEFKEKAKQFLEEKNLDLVVANDIEKGVFGSEDAEIIIVSKDASKDIGLEPKTTLAMHIWEEIQLRMAHSRPF